MGGTAMISLPTEEFKQIFVKDLLISSEKVAHVQVTNSLEHAMLVLVKSGYSAIPVLDPTYKLHGLISTAMILDRILGLERIEFERLEHMKVEEVMNRDIPRLKLDNTFSEGLEAVINHPFICVENEDGYFEGILTRRAILKLLNKKVRRYNK
jgi:predicted transcriptional regulator